MAPPTASGIGLGRAPSRSDSPRTSLAPLPNQQKRIQSDRYVAGGPRSVSRQSENANDDDQPRVLEPHTPLACQVAATRAWRADLARLWRSASDRFPDVCWAPAGEDDEDDDDDDDGLASATDDEGAAPSMGHSIRSLRSLRSSSTSREELIWAHKAVLYARAPNTFQTRFLGLQTPAARLGNDAANASAVSLPLGFRGPSPAPSSINSHVSGRSSTASSSRHGHRQRSSRNPRQRLIVRGSAPPSSFSMPRRGFGVSDSDSEAGVGTDGEDFDLTDDDGAGSSTGHWRPASPGASSLAPSTADSTASTIRPPMSLRGVGREFFEATLEYLYTAEESMVDTFEFLFESGAPSTVEERLDKLRQDFVYMWRSRLYSDVTVVLGDGAVGTIPDANASVISLATIDTNADASSIYSSANQGDDSEPLGPPSFAAHRFMLASRSAYFAAQLLSPYADSNAPTLRLPSPPFTPASTHFTLGFLYTGTLFFSNRTFDLATAFQLWRCGAYLGVDTLQALVSALIAHDFCHGFTCSPPCRTCIKRVPRALAFASSPDVADTQLTSLARAAVSGPHFGVYWARDVGSLPYEARGELVSAVCARIDADVTGGAIVSSLRQLAIVGRRIDTERGAGWVDSLRWMCETVESHIRACFEARLDDVVASAEWNELVDGVGFSADVLEKALLVLLEGLSDAGAARAYETLVGRVLLRDDEDGPRPPTGVPLQLLEEARSKMLQRMRKRWVTMRAAGGAFDGLSPWALKEIAGEIDVSADALLGGGEAISAAAAKSRTGLVAAVPRKSASPIVSVEDAAAEREAGPIHMRAAVLNRNAARTAATHGLRSASTEPTPTAAVAAAAAARARIGSGEAATATAARTPASTSSPAPARVMPRSPSPATSARPAPSSRAPPAPAPSSASSSGSAVRAARAKFEAASRGTASPSVRSTTFSSRSSTFSTSSAAASSTISSSGNAESSTTATTVPRPSQRSAPGSVAARTSAATSRGSPLSTDSAANTSRSAATAASSSRTRKASTSTIVSVASVASRKTPSIRSLRGVAAGASSSSTADAKVVKSRVSQQRLVKAPSSTSVAQPKAQPAQPKPKDAPVAASAEDEEVGDATLTASPKKADPALPDPPSEARAQSLSPPPPTATLLSQGIPCIVAPKANQRSGSKALRFRATVRYIGPLQVEGAGEGPWLGVEVPLPLPAGLTEEEVNDGSLGGVRYFWPGGGAAAAGSASSKRGEEGGVGGEASGPPEREARRRRIAQLTERSSQGGAQPWQTPPSVVVVEEEDMERSVERLPPSAKRRRDVSGGSATEQQAVVPTRGLFIRPSSVLWVCV